MSLKPFDMSLEKGCSIWVRAPNNIWSSLAT